MLFLKKSSVFFSKISKLYINLVKCDIFAIYNFFGSFSYIFRKILSIIDFKILNYILISSAFVSLIFYDISKNFFKFLSPYSFIIFFSSFNFFLDVKFKLKNIISLFLIGVCYKFFFFSIDKILNFSVDLNNLIDLTYLIYNYIIFFCKFIFLYFYIFFRLFLI